MTTGAESNQIVHHIVTELTPRLHMMDLQGFHRSALLAPPAISLENTRPDDFVFFRIQFESRSFLA